MLGQGTEKKSSLKDLHRQIVVQEAAAILLPGKEASRQLLLIIGEIQT
jgi:hypothetical protein